MNAVRGGIALAVVCLMTPAAWASDPCELNNNTLPAMALEDAFLCLSRLRDVAVYADARRLTGQSSPAVRMDRPVLAVAEDLVSEAQLQIRITADDALMVTALPVPLEEDRGAPVPEAEPDVIVVRGYAAAFASASAREREAFDVIEVLNAEEAGQFPDQNLSEAVQRVSGVSLVRRNGEGETVSIRGLPPEFTMLEIDGRPTIVNAETADPDRASLFAVIDADLYGRIEVIKTPQAHEVEGALGGIVRLVTPNPLEGPAARGGYEMRLSWAERRDQLEPGVTGAWSARTEDEAWGVSLAGTFEALDRRLDIIQSPQGWMPLTPEAALSQPALEGARLPERLRTQQRQGDRYRTNLTTKLQHRDDQGRVWGLSGLYARDSRDETRSRLQLNFQDAELREGVRDGQGRLSSARFTDVEADVRQFDRDTVIESFGVTASLRQAFGGGAVAEHSLGGNWSQERLTEFASRAQAASLSSGGYDNPGAGAPLSVYSDLASLPLSELVVDRLSYGERQITNQSVFLRSDWQGELDRGPFVGWRVGYRVAQSQYRRLQGQLMSDLDGLSISALANGYGLTGDFGAGSEYAGVQAWPSFDPAQAYAQAPSTFAFAFDDENQWRIKETSLAGHGALHMHADLSPRWQLSAQAGLRLVHTGYEGRGRINIQIPISEDENQEFRLDDQPARTHTYTDSLPNLQLRLDDDTGWVIRASVSRGMARPTVQQINPGIEVHTGDRELTRGEPSLKPYSAWQYDASVERYFGPDLNSVISFGGFIKDVSNFVASDRRTEVYAFPEAGLSAQTYTVRTWRNGGEALLGGVELGVQTGLDVLHPRLEGFGIYANATFTRSDLTVNGRESDFPGASNENWNIVAYYEREAFSARLAWNDRSDYLEDVAGRDGLNAGYGAGGGRLDFALRYRFNSGYRLALDVFNLTSVNEARYWDDPEQLRSVFIEGPIVSVGLGRRF